MIRNLRSANSFKVLRAMYETWLSLVADIFSDCHLRIRIRKVNSRKIVSRVVLRLFNVHSSNFCIEPTALTAFAVSAGARKREAVL